MPMHPAAPEDRSGLLDAFEQIINSIIGLGLSCREADFEKPTEYTGWTVKDQIAHVVGAQKAFAGIPRQQVDVPEYAHVRNDLERIVEMDVEARRPQPGRMVVQELAAFHPERMEALRRSSLELDSPITVDVSGVGGMGVESCSADGMQTGKTTFGQQLRLRTIDSWTHEQDLRAALDAPGDLDSAGAALFTEEILGALPRIVAREAKVPAGHDVVIDVSGPVVAREGVRVREGEDGRPYGELLYSGVDRPEGQESHEVTTIHLTTEALTRRAAGRRSVDEIHYSVTGDEEVARRVLEALVLLTWSPGA